MRNPGLSLDYIRRARIRVQALDVLFEGESWADVVREAQEIVELALKALLRAHGIDPPRVHDVSDVLLAERDRLPEDRQVVPDEQPRRHETAHRHAGRQDEHRALVEREPAERALELVTIGDRLEVVRRVSPPER